MALPVDYGTNDCTFVVFTQLWYSSRLNWWCCDQYGCYNDSVATAAGPELGHCKAFNILIAAVWQLSNLHNTWIKYRSVDTRWWYRWMTKTENIFRIVQLLDVFGDLSVLIIMHCYDHSLLQNYLPYANTGQLPGDQTNIADTRKRFFKITICICLYAT